MGSEMCIRDRVAYVLSSQPLDDGGGLPPPSLLLLPPPSPPTGGGNGLSPNARRSLQAALLAPGDGGCEEVTDADWIAPAERPSSFPAIPCGGGSDPYASCAGVRYDAPVTDDYKVARRYKLQVRGTDMAGNSNVDDHIIWRLSANLKFQKVEWAAPPQETCDVVGGGGASSGDSGIDGFTLSMAVRHLEPTTQELGYLSLIHI